jgi:hypothetical protein
MKLTGNICGSASITAGHMSPQNRIESCVNLGSRQNALSKKKNIRLYRKPSSDPASKLHSDRVIRLCASAIHVAITCFSD